MSIEIVDLPIKNGGSFHSYVKLPEGKPEAHFPIHYQRFAMIHHEVTMFFLCDSEGEFVSDNWQINPQQIMVNIINPSYVIPHKEL